MTEMKSNRGRPQGEPKDDVHIKIPTDVALFFRLRFIDSFSGRMSKGAFSELVTRLLREERRKLLKEETANVGEKNEQDSNQPGGNSAGANRPIPG